LPNRYMGQLNMFLDTFMVIMAAVLIITLCPIWYGEEMYINFINNKVESELNLCLEEATGFGKADSELLRRGMDRISLYADGVTLCMEILTPAVTDSDSIFRYDIVSASDNQKVLPIWEDSVIRVNMNYSYKLPALFHHSGVTKMEKCKSSGT